MKSEKYDDLSREDLIRLLARREKEPRRRFGLVWEQDDLEREAALNADFVALEQDGALSCGGAPYRNLLIEGDNFDALRYLRMTHAGRVKCIYIDPPYNTGNRDFVYNDRFLDKDDAFRHSKWLEFMYRRLALARDLLRDDGAIFVSIDDNEIFALGMLMNQIFGEANFVANIIWQKRYSCANDHKTIAPMHDFVIVYRMSESWRRNLLPRGEEKDRQYRFEDEKGVFRCSDYTCPKSAEERPNLYYAVTNPNTGEEVWPKRTRVWAYSPDEHLRNVAEDLVYWGKDGKGKVPAFKRYKHALRHGDGVVPTTWWPHEEVGHNDSAKKELMALLPEDERSFSTPKPTGLIERILRIAAGPSDLVLDFFAGSGTTGHAVLKLNAEDGGTRRFILVSNSEATADRPEKNLCRDVCARRMRRVIEGYGGLPGLGGGFAYLRARRVGIGELGALSADPVWLAVALFHFGMIPANAVAGEAWYAAVTDDACVAYLPRVDGESVRKLLDLMDKSDAPATVYTHQVSALRQRLGRPEAEILPVPEMIVKRFGLEVTP